MDKANALSQINLRELNYSQVEEIIDELTPSKRFMHSRHSSNSQQQQYFESGMRAALFRRDTSPKNENLLSEQSPSNLTRDFLKSNTEQSP